MKLTIRNRRLTYSTLFRFFLLSWFLGSAIYGLGAVAINVLHFYFIGWRAIPNIHDLGPIEMLLENLTIWSIASYVAYFIFQTFLSAVIFVFGAWLVQKLFEIELEIIEE